MDDGSKRMMMVAEAVTAAGEDHDVVFVAAISAIGAVLVALVSGLMMWAIERMRRENRLQHSAASKEREETAKVVVAALDEKLVPVNEKLEEAAKHAEASARLLEMHIELEQQRWELHHQRLHRLEMLWGEQH